jgi:hypothetical protein
LQPEAIRADVQAMGNSALVVGDADLVRVHVHVADPQVPLKYGARWGALSDTLVEDLNAQAAAYTAGRLAEVTNGTAIVAVAPGAGWAALFQEQGAVVVRGGQTMNPSVNDLLNAVRATGAARAILLPNNANVLLSAQQAAALAAAEGLQLAVVPSRNLPAGLAALLASTVRRADIELPLEALTAAMTSALDTVRSGEVTTATRDLRSEGSPEVRAGQIIGLIDEKIAAAGEEVGAVMMVLLEKLEAAGREIITLYAGDSVPDGEAAALAARVQGEYPAQAVEWLRGGQPHYPYLIGVE